MADDGSSSGRSRTLMIVLGVVAALGLVSCIACGAAGAFCAAEMPAAAPRQPPLYDAALYQGTWVGEGPTSLTVGATNVRWEHQDGASHVQYTGTFTGISGQDILVGVLVTDVTLVVSDPPHQDPTSGRFTMTVEGVRLERQ